MKFMTKGLAASVAGLIAASGVAAESIPEPVRKPNPQMQRERQDSNSAKKNEKFSRKRVTTKRKKDAIRSSLSSATTSSAIPAPGATSTAPIQKIAKRPSVLDKMRASVLFEYYGSSIVEPFSGYQPDRDSGYSQSGDKVWLLTRATAGYAITPNLTLSANGYFLNHGSTLDTESGMQKGDAASFVFRPDMSFLRLNVGKFAQLGKVKWAGDFRLYPGLGKASHGQPVYLRTGQNFFLPLNSQWSLASYNTIRYFHRTSAHYDERERLIAKDGEKPSLARVDYLFQLGPAIEYQALDNLGVSLSYNWTMAHDYLNNTFSEGGELAGVFWQPYFELGFAWDITKRINFNPYVDWLMKTPNIEAAQIGANLNISFL